MDNYQALYQLRSAIALGAIGGPDARKALESALELPARNDVKQAIKEALKRQGNESAFASMCTRLGVHCQLRQVKQK